MFTWCTWNIIKITCFTWLQTHKYRGNLVYLSASHLVEKLLLYIFKHLLVNWSSFNGSGSGDFQ